MLQKLAGLIVFYKFVRWTGGKSMSFLPYLHFFCFLACAYAAVLVFYKDFRSILTRACAILMSCFALWNLGDVFLHNPDITLTKESAQLLMNIFSTSWISFTSVLLCFSLAFSKRKKWFRNKWFWAFIIILPVLFIYIQWTNGLTIDPLQQNYGWSFGWNDTIWTYLFYLYYSLISLLSIYLIYSYGRKTKKIIEKKQARILTFTVIASFVFGTIFDVALPRFGVFGIPSLGNIFLLIFAVGLFWVIVKYRFLSITPATAAEDIISAMDELLILFNQEGYILTVNKATLESLHYEPKELEGKYISVLFKEGDLMENLLERITKEEFIKNQTSTFLTKKGKEVPIFYSNSTLRNEEGMVIGNVFIARDITEYKKIEQELITAKAQAEESDRLKSAFLANMSHEIRTPMNGILGFTELLKEPDLTGEDQKKYIGIIEKSGARMLNIINDIISISKVESGQMTVNISETNVNEQLEFIYNFFKPEIEQKGLQIFYKRKVAANELIIKTDREKVYAILTNLTKNAIKFTHQGFIEIGYKIKGRYLEYFVRDTGKGIGSEKIDVIFKRFMQGDGSLNRIHEGAGLGLAISKAYVEMLGGKIWVESEEGKGSSFHFTIPFDREPMEENRNTEVSEREDEEVQIHNLKVLIVDDDETSDLLITCALRNMILNPLHAFTGFEAVEACHANPDIDIILMDIQLPGLDGYDATRQIRMFNKDVVIIAQTALALTGDREKALEAGCDEYTAKPIDIALLKRLIKKHLKR